jgi:hypothetical protein
MARPLGVVQKIKADAGLGCGTCLWKQPIEVWEYDELPQERMSAAAIPDARKGSLRGVEAIRKTVTQRQDDQTS